MSRGPGPRTGAPPPEGADVGYPLAGENTGVHLVVWLNDVRPRDLTAVIARARAAGVGLYSIAPFHRSPPPRAGLLFGYASLTEAEIRAGIRRMADIL